MGADYNEREVKVGYAGTLAGIIFSEVIGVCVLHVQGLIRHKILNQEKVFLLSDGQKTLALLLSRTQSTLASYLGSSPSKTVLHARIKLYFFRLTAFAVLKFLLLYS